jgi:hypothetical protein
MVFRIQIGYHKYYKGKQVHNLFFYLEPNRYNILYLADTQAGTIWIDQMDHIFYNH